MRVANISGGRTSAYMGIRLHESGFDGRKCIGIELNPEYAEIAKQRIPELNIIEDDWSFLDE